MKFAKVQDQLDLIIRGTEEIIPIEDLEKARWYLSRLIDRATSMGDKEIVNQYKEALLDSLRNDLSRHQKKIFGSGSLPDGIHGYYKALEEECAL